jgi:hypothetical protein
MKMRIERNDDPKMKQKKCRKGLRRELAQRIERIPAAPPLHDVRLTDKDPKWASSLK